jgi:hypothetical protein
MMLRLAACRPSAVAEPAASPSPPAAEANEVCTPLPPRDRTRALSAAARAELEASRDGEHYVTSKFEPAMARLREAAQGGERAAQFLYAQTRFSTMFGSEAPQTAQRAAYVEAIMFSRTAALAQMLPEKGAAAPADITSAKPIGLGFPLSALPADWLQEAWAQADAWIACHGRPW